MATSVRYKALAAEFVLDVHKTSRVENVELVMNYIVGYMLVQERYMIRQLSKQASECGQNAFKLKSAPWLKATVLTKMKAYETEQNREDKSEEEEKEEEEEDEEDEKEEDEEENEQRKWVFKCVNEMVTDFQYELLLAEKEFKKDGDLALQVSIFASRCLESNTLQSIIKIS